MKSIRRLLRNKRGIDTILAALLMVVIVVVASVMVYAWSTGLLGSLLVTPTAGKEALNIENAAFASNSTNVALYLRNTGSVAITLSTYYVKDATGNQWSKFNWAGPTIQPNGLGTVPLNIACTSSGCQYSGTASAFNTFASGSSYTVLVVTSRNNQFSFPVTR